VPAVAVKLAAVRAEPVLAARVRAQAVLAAAVVLVVVVVAAAAAGVVGAAAAGSAAFLFHSGEPGMVHPISIPAFLSF
jgi:hypothetical protein